MEDLSKDFIHQKTCQRISLFRIPVNAFFLYKICNGILCIERPKMDSLHWGLENNIIFKKGHISFFQTWAGFLFCKMFFSLGDFEITFALK